MKQQMIRRERLTDYALRITPRRFPLGFIMDGLESDAYDRTYSDRALIRRMLGYFAPQWRPMLVVVLMILLDSAVSAALPVVVSRSLDVVMRAPAQAPIVLFGMAVLVLAASGWLMNYLRQSRSARAVGEVGVKLRDDTLKAVTERALSFYE